MAKPSIVVAAAAAVPGVDNKIADTDPPYSADIYSEINSSMEISGDML